jgi:methyl-accepting chemotaxis protein
MVLGAGNLLVEQAGGTMSKIAESVRSVTTLMEQISTASA